MTTSTIKHIFYLSVLGLLIIGCEQSDANNDAKQIAIKSSRDGEHEQKNDFFSTDLVYNINGISVLDTFELNEYLKVLGLPNSIRRGEPAIIEEFGYDDYDLWYGKNNINAGHGYILTAKIEEAGISFNGIQVGDRQAKIEDTFNIPRSEKDKIKVINKNDDVLTFYLDRQIIQSISFWRPL